MHHGFMLPAEIQRERRRAISFRHAKMISTRVSMTEVINTHFSRLTRYFHDTRFAARDTSSADRFHLDFSRHHQLRAFIS